MVYFLVFQYYGESWLRGEFSNIFRLVLYEDSKVLSNRDKCFKRLFEGIEYFKKVYCEYGLFCGG